MIPVNEPLLNKNTLKYVNECIKTNWISSEGKFIKEFEDKWSEYCGMHYGIAVSSGTAALEIAMECLGLEPGGEVIIPAFTIISCAIAVLKAGAKPVLVDCDPETWCMDVNQIQEKISSKTRAIMPVHIYGHPVDMDPILKLAKKHDLFVIEDAAEAHGAKYKNKIVGGLGDLSCYSFYANKIITTGEGGMVLAKRKEHAEELRSLKNLCFLKERRFFHKRLGHNYRMTNVQAAIGLSQVEDIENLLNKKRWIGKSYNERLKKYSQLILPVEKEWANNVYWMYGIVLADDVKYNAKELERRLKGNGVDTRPFFIGMHEQPVLKEMGLFKGERYPVSEKISRKGLYLPSGLALSESQIDQVCKDVKISIENK